MGWRDSQRVYEHKITRRTLSHALEQIVELSHTPVMRFFCELNRYVIEHGEGPKYGVVSKATLAEVANFVNATVMDGDTLSVNDVEIIVADVGELVFFTK